jgi:hypothetical protein
MTGSVRAASEQQARRSFGEIFGDELTATALKTKTGASTQKSSRCEDDSYRLKDPRPRPTQPPTIDPPAQPALRCCSASARPVSTPQHRRARIATGPPASGIEDAC